MTVEDLLRPIRNGSSEAVHEAEPVIDLRVLGPLELIVSGRPVRLGPVQRVLLLCLWLALGQVVPAARLRDLVWAGSAPAGWQATLRSHVCHLRRAIGETAVSEAAGAVLVTERVGVDFGYALRISAGAVDAVRFERLEGEGRRALGVARYAAAAALLGDALTLWRGRPLSDLGEQPCAVPEIRRLEGLHRAARMARLEAESQLGLHREVTGELEAMLARWPADEGLRRLLVACLCRSGRWEDAATACRDGIDLAMEQGLDLTALQALQHAVLHGSPVPWPR
jgi:DNA-binding SARP family transcriptional activator